jgi:ribosomal protein S11
LLKNNKKLFSYFLKTKDNLYLRAFKLFFFKFLRKISLFSLLFNNLFFKFYLFKYLKFFILRFRKTTLNISLKDIFNMSFTDFSSLSRGKSKSRSRGKKKFKITKRIKRKLRFYYNLYKKTKKFYKLKLKMVNSNFFITLTDFKNNVILTKSTGQVSGNRKKKVKLSPYLVARMMYPVLNKIRKMKIKFLFLFVNSKINRHINNVIKSLKNNSSTKILKIIFSKPIAHHFGTRKPKLRRL